MQEITIAGEVFKIAPRYSDGHTLSENEASALNQTFFENIRNNMASAVKASKEKGDFDIDVMQDEVTKYAEDYEFGARRGPGTPKDPIRALALRFATTAIGKSLKEKFDKDHGFTSAEVKELANKLLDHPTKGPKYLAKAKEVYALTSVDEGDDTLEGLGVEKAA
jgi:hypothetical protein